MAEISEEAKILIGVFVCLIILLAIVIIITVCCIRRRRRRKQTRSRYRYPANMGHTFRTKRRILGFQRKQIVTYPWPQDNYLQNSLKFDGPIRNSFKVDGPMSNNFRFGNQVPQSQPAIQSTKPPIVIPYKSLENAIDAKWQWNETDKTKMAISWPNDGNSKKGITGETETQSASVRISASVLEDQQEQTKSQSTPNPTITLTDDQNKTSALDKKDTNHVPSIINKYHNMQLVPYQTAYYGQNQANLYQNMAFPVFAHFPPVDKRDGLLSVDEIDVFPYYFGQGYPDDRRLSDSSDFSSSTSKKKSSVSNTSNKNLIPYDKVDKHDKESLRSSDRSRSKSSHKTDSRRSRKKRISKSVENIHDAYKVENVNRVNAMDSSDDDQKGDNPINEYEHKRRRSRSVSSIEERTKNNNNSLVRYGWNRSEKRYTSTFVLDDEEPTKPKHVDQEEDIKYATPIKGRQMPVGYILQRDNYQDYFGQFSENVKSVSRVRQIKSGEEENQNRNQRMNEWSNNDRRFYDNALQREYDRRPFGNALQTEGGNRSFRDTLQTESASRSFDNALQTENESRSFGNALHVERSYNQRGSGMVHHNRRKDPRDETVKLEIPMSYLQNYQNYKRYDIPLKTSQTKRIDSRTYETEGSNIISRGSRPYPYDMSESQRNPSANTNYPTDLIENNTDQIRHKWQSNTRSKATTRPTKVSDGISHMGSYRPDADTERHRNDQLYPGFLEVRIRNEHNSRMDLSG